MSSGPVCRCPESMKPLRARAWTVLDYRCNYSHFNGRRYTPSDYSAIQCKSCHAVWRTKAGYVEYLR